MRWAPLVAITAASTLVVCGQAAPGFDPHDLSGHWNRSSRFQTFSNVWSGQGPTQGTEEAPFTETGKARFEKNKPGYGLRAVPPAIGNDPMGTCDPLGIPRLLNTEVISPHQTMEIVQVPGRTIQLFEWHHDWREIFTDGRKLPTTDEVEPSWNGTSIGRWDGDVFVVASIGFDDRTWLDKFGYPHSENMRLEERYRRRDRDTLELTMTLTDPETYTRPWVSDTKIFRIDREKSKRWDEQIYCVPTEEYKFNQRVRDVAGGKESKQ